MPDSLPMALCRCTDAEWILLIATLLLLLAFRTWRRRDRSVHGLKLAARLAAAYLASLAAAGAGIWLHNRGGSAGPLERPALAAQASSICTAADAKTVAYLANAELDYLPPDLGSTLAKFARQESHDLRSLTPAADVATDWRAVVADVVAQADWMAAVQTGNTDAPEPRRRTVRRGRAAARRLGVHCRLIDI